VFGFPSFIEISSRECYYGQPDARRDSVASSGSTAVNLARPTAHISFRRKSEGWTEVVCVGLVVPLLLREGVVAFASKIRHVFRLVETCVVFRLPVACVSSLSLAESRLVSPTMSFRRYPRRRFCNRGVDGSEDLDSGSCVGVDVL
jgi:hypothetical protein